MIPRGSRVQPAPAAPAGAAPGAAPPGAAHPATAATDATAPADTSAHTGTLLNDAQALTRWRVPISTRWGSVVLTLFTDRHTPTGEPATADAGELAGAAGRVVGGLFARDVQTIRSAASDLLHSAAEVVSHFHLGLHWKPAQPIPAPAPAPAPVATADKKGIAPPSAGG